MYREKRPAKYLEDLNVYTKRQINILYFNGYGRDPTDKELKDLLAKSDALDDFENIQFILKRHTDSRAKKRTPEIGVFGLALFSRSERKFKT